MGKHFCKECGVKLNRKNAYPNRKRKRGYRIFCKECDKKKRTESRRLNGQTSRLRLKGKYRRIIIEFPDQFAKQFFLLCRRQQVIGCHPKCGHSSRSGQRVEHLEEATDKHGELHRWYEETICDECGQIVEFNVHGFKQCTSCGLLSANFTLSNEMDESEARDLPQEEYYNYAGRGNTSDEVPA